jgi:hydrogenase maturation protein HypF
MNTYEIKIKGIVQGVGFRPFIYKLALSSKLNGQVSNNDEGVLIVVNCTKEQLDIFIEHIKQNPPKLSKIHHIKSHKLTSFKIYKEFKIIQSQNNNNKSTFVSPDIGVCDECIKEIKDPKNFRFKYPLTNCTNCGPRYTIIKSIPYDRINTSLKEFTLCSKCKNEYENPLDRRYHAQAIACKKCGPTITLYDKKANVVSTSSKAIKDIAKEVKKGKFVAIKGVGGFHIVCDASNKKAIDLLRLKKQRPKKPFAVMFPNLEILKGHLELNVQELKLVKSIQKPIVLLKKKSTSSLLNSISPNSTTIGGFLPYTPLHHLFFQEFQNPIIATSANLKGEPITKDLDELFEKISHLIDFVLDFNRDIINFCDDSVLRIIDKKIVNIRNSRGYAPTVFNLENNSKNILALGANQKSNISLAFGNNIVVSPYISDLDSIESIEALKRTIDTFKKFYDFKPDVIVCDLHPNYDSTKYAKELASIYKIPLISVQHHHAHILATMFEHDLKGEVLGICFDGTGLGDDGNLWGGEILKVSKESYTRLAHINNFKLLGASKAIKEPKRVALSMLFDNYSLQEVLELNLSSVKAFSNFEIKTLHSSWQKGVNAPLTSSVGRVFDAVASLIGICHVQSYEGQTGILLEELYDHNIKDAFDFEIHLKIIDINPMVRSIVKEIVKEIRNGDKINIQKTIASKFINTLVNIIYTMAKKYNLPVVLSGGVFQNKTLLSLVCKKFKENNIKYYFSSKVPLNDGGISLGQIFYAL